MFILVQTFCNYKSTPSFATEYSLIIVSLCSKISLTHFVLIDCYAGTVKTLLVTVPVSLYGSTHTNQLIATAHHTYHFYRVCGNSLLKIKDPIVFIQ